MRLFFAVCPDHETRRSIVTAGRALELSEGSRCVPAENYHMTLAFADDVPNAQAAELRSLRPIEVPAFTVLFDSYEHWPKSEVVVIAARQCPAALQELHQMLRAELARQGAEPDSQPFRPHVTIARKVVQPPVFQAMSQVTWTVSDFQLARSVRSASGSVYTVLDRWPLLDKASNAE
jgi:2'-5' RNA ligase